MIYLTILAAVFSAVSIVRIILLNAEVKTLEAARSNAYEPIAAWEAKNPIDYTTFETFTASKEKMPEELKELETEYAWLLAERDSKKESRTNWYGGGIVSLVALVIALSLLIGEPR